MAQLNDNTLRGRNLLLLLYAGLGINLLSMLHSWYEIELLKDIMVMDFDERTAQMSDMIALVLGIVEMGVRILTIVFFVMWFRRAYFNLHQIQPHSMSFPEGWAAGAWFVPFVNLVRPFQIMKEIWRDTFNLTDPENGNKRGIVMLGFWWACWLTSIILGRIAFEKARNAESIEELINVDKWMLLAGTLDIVLTILIIRIIMQLRPAEAKLYDQYNQMDIADHLVPHTVF